LGVPRGDDNGHGGWPDTAGSKGRTTGTTAGGEAGPPTKSEAAVLATALFAATGQVAAEVDNARVGATVVEQAARLLSAADVRLTLLDQSSDTLVLHSAVGPAAAALGTHQPSGAGLAGTVLQTGTPVRRPAVPSTPVAGSADEPPGPAVAVPLRDKGLLLGVLLAGRPRTAAQFTVTDQMALQVLADLAGARLGTAYLSAARQARARELAVLDPAWRPPPDQAGDFILVVKNRRQVIDADGAASRFLGYPRPALLERVLADIIPMPAWADQVDNLGAIRGEMLAGKTFTFDTVVRRRDANLIPVRLELRAFPVPDGFVARGIFHDRRTEERAQAWALQAETLRLLSDIGSGLAHAINSPLAIVLGNMEMLLGETQDPDVRALLEPARNAAERISRALQDLQRFARPVMPGAWTEIDVGQLARDSVEASRPLWETGSKAAGQSICVRVEVQGRLPIRGHALELQEALHELLTNAAQALPEGGTIVVRTEDAQGQVAITVADDGVGMSENIRQFCMEPFFTTRRPSGNGLGLNRVEHIVQRHRGTVEIESAEGQGTRVTLRFPLLRSND